MSSLVSSKHTHTRKRKKSKLQIYHASFSLDCLFCYKTCFDIHISINTRLQIDFFTNVWNFTLNVYVLFSRNGSWYKATMNKKTRHTDFHTIVFNLTPVDVIQRILRQINHNLIPSANKFMKRHNLFNSQTKTEIQLWFIIAKLSTRSVQNCIQAYLSEY